MVVCDWTGATIDLPNLLQLFCLYELLSLSTANINILVEKISVLNCHVFYVRETISFAWCGLTQSSAVTTGYVIKDAALEFFFLK